MEDGKVIDKKVTVAEFAETLIGKNQVEIDLVQDDSIYEFRVRAYRKVNGRKVYGSWSEPYTLKETLNLDEIFKELRQYMIDYAAKNEPRWHYDDSRTASAVGSQTTIPTASGRAFPSTRSRKESSQDIKPAIEDYLSPSSRDRVAARQGYLYLFRVVPGDRQDAFQ